MDTFGTIGEGSFCLDPEAEVNTLLNDATATLQYARGMTELLIESLQEDDILDRRRVLMVLGGIGTLMAMGLRCTSQAHAKMEWDRI